MATLNAIKTAWALDTAHSQIQFKVKHLAISTVTGNFTVFEGNAESNGENFEDAKISFSTDVSSINTANEQRDGHLKGADFFDAEKFPKILFQSTSVTKKEEGLYDIKGNLTIKGISKAVTLQAEYSGTAKDPWGNTKAGFELKGKINRKDWGLNWNAALETGG